MRGRVHSSIHTATKNSCYQVHILHLLAKTTVQLNMETIGFIKMIASICLDNGCCHTREACLCAHVDFCTDSFSPYLISNLVLILAKSLLDICKEPPPLSSRLLRQLMRRALLGGVHTDSLYSETNGQDPFWSSHMCFIVFTKVEGRPLWYVFQKEKKNSFTHPNQHVFQSMGQLDLHFSPVNVEICQARICRYIFSNHTKRRFSKIVFSVCHVVLFQG